MSASKTKSDVNMIQGVHLAKLILAMARFSNTALQSLKFRNCVLWGRTSSKSSLLSISLDAITRRFTYLAMAISRPAPCGVLNTAIIYYKPQYVQLSLNKQCEVYRVTYHNIIYDYLIQYIHTYIYVHIQHTHNIHIYKKYTFAITSASSPP